MKFVAIGRSQVLYNSIETLVNEGHELSAIVTSKPAPEFTKREKHFEELAKEHGVPFTVASKDSDIGSFLSTTKASVAVSCNNLSILSTQTINLFPMGVLNAHGGDLPRYRGNACQAWAILNGETSVGLVIHKMVGGEVDVGEIMAREYLEIDEMTKVTQVIQWIQERTPVLFNKSLQSLSQNPNFSLGNSALMGESLRCYPRRSEDGRIRWSETAEVVLRLINATNRPYAGAYAFTESKQKITIWDAKVASVEEKILAVPGQVINVNEGFVDVACGSGVLRILNIESDSGESNPSKVLRSTRARLC